MVSLEKLDKARKKAVEAYEGCVASRRALEEVSKEFEEVKDTPLMAARIRAVAALKKFKEEHPSKHTLWSLEDHGDFDGMIENLTSFFIKDPEESHSAEAIEIVLKAILKIE